MNTGLQDIVVVGAGPSGLALGAELRRLGLSPVIFDRQAAGQNTSRACVVHARTLEVLEPMGASRDLLGEGLIVPIFRIRDKNKILATIDFKDLKTAYPFTLMCPQNRVEAILLQKFEALGGAVERPMDVTDIREASDEIHLQLKGAGGIISLGVRWIVGCDGAHSVVRERASIPFEGGAYDESFWLADVEMDWPLDREEVTLFYSEKGLVVVAPLPKNHFRIVATVQDAAQEPVLEDFESILKERGPQSGTPKIRHMVWSSRFHIQHRVAKVLRKGHILLTGDAAHVHSPAGGQGMNTGIQDAISLAGALQQTLQSGDEAILDKWQEERLKVAHSVVDMTDRMTRVATTASPILKKLRNTVVELLGHIPLATHAAAEKLAELKQ